MNTTTNTTATIALEPWRVHAAMEATIQVESIADMLQQGLARIHERSGCNEAQALLWLAARLEVLCALQCEALSDEAAERQDVERELLTPAERRAVRQPADVGALKLSGRA